MVAARTSDGAVVLTDGLHQSASESKAWSKPQNEELKNAALVVVL